MVSLKSESNEWVASKWTKRGGAPEVGLALKSATGGVLVCTAMMTWATLVLTWPKLFVTVNCAGKSPWVVYWWVNAGLDWVTGLLPSPKFKV